MPKEKHREKGSPTCFLNIDNNSMDVTFPQDYGPDKTFTYYVTDQAIQQSKSDKNIDSIVNEVARSIASSWQSRKQAGGASYISQFENAKGYLWRCLSEQQIQTYEKMQRGDQHQTNLLQFFNIEDVLKRKQDVYKEKDRISRILIDFLKNNDLWYVLYHQASKTKQALIQEWYRIFFR